MDDVSAREQVADPPALGFITIQVLTMLAYIAVIAVTWTKMYRPVKDALKMRTRVVTTCAILLADGQSTRFGQRMMPLNWNVSRKPLFCVSSHSLSALSILRGHTST